MRSEAATVDEYIEAAPNERRAALEALRSISLEHLAGYKESMDYGMPGYGRPGEEIEVAFASQARYISVYIMRKAVLDRHRAELTSSNVGKGCVRYANPEKVDFEVIATMLQESALDRGPIC